MGHIPYGYKIVDGKAAVDEEQAENIREFYNGYISGLTLKGAAEKVGLSLCHGSADRMLRNKHYLGDDFYPPIIDKETFDKAEGVRLERASTQGKIRKLEKTINPRVNTNFTIPKVDITYTDPFKQAEYVYGLIESVVEEYE